MAELQPGGSGVPRGPRQAGGSGDEAAPAGSVYDWYRRGVDLLEGRNHAAAAQVLQHAAAAEPHSRSVREALARAQYGAGRFREARASFARILDGDPADDYAHFGLGLALARTGDLRRAVEHLAMAAVMRPESVEYAAELRRARARLAATA